MSSYIQRRGEMIPLDQRQLIAKRYCYLRIAESFQVGAEKAAAGKKDITCKQSV